MTEVPNKTIKMKHIDINPRIYTDFNKENNNLTLKLKVVDNVRVGNNKNIFANVFDPNWSEESLFD